MKSLLSLIYGCIFIVSLERELEGTGNNLAFIHLGTENLGTQAQHFCNLRYIVNFTQSEDRP